MAFWREKLLCCEKTQRFPVLQKSLSTLLQKTLNQVEEKEIVLKNVMNSIFLEIAS